MRKFLFVTLILSVFSAVAELPILHTTYRKASLETVKEYAEGGRAEAQLELALRFYAGHQVDKNVQQAFQLMHLAAEQKQPEALFLLSRMYAEGIGTRADPEKEELFFAEAIANDPENEELQALYDRYVSDTARAQRFLKTCADAGYAPALLDVGLPEAVHFYKTGQFEDALPLFLKLAGNGSAESAYYAGRIYADGKGNLEPDDIEAFVWFKQAAEGGYAPAQYELAVRYEKGLGVEADSEQAGVWFEQAAGSGNAEAQFRLAEKKFRRAAAAESMDQPNEYRKSLSEAVKWYKAAAEQNHAEALFVLGRLSASGEGMSKNLSGAVEYYERAAALGHAEAGFYLGLMHHAGLGVDKKDMAAAIQYYQAAADQGVAGALYYLANCYCFGEGVPKQPIKGEGLYYGKILQRAPGANPSANVWALAAAREYGIIRWNRSDSRDQLIAASSWVGLAAQNGDELAQQIFLKMKKNSRQDGPHELFAQNRAAPNVDAVKKMRNAAFFPYVQWDIDDLYKRSEARQPIISVQAGNGIQKSVAGNDVEGLFVRYARPAASRAHGFSGIVLAGLEFTSRKTGERYFSFVTYLDREPTYAGKSVYNLSVTVDTTAVSDEKLTGWAVVYGHLLPDGRTIAVFDDQAFQAEDIAELFQRNRYSKTIKSNAAAYMEFDSVIDVKEPIQKNDGLLNLLN